MKHLQNLFIIRFPFMLLGAEEAIHRYNLKNNILVIVTSDTNPETHKKQLNKQIDEQLWDKIIYHNTIKGSNLLFNAKLIYSLQKNTYNYVFIKNTFVEFDQVIISNLKYQKLILLEDGSLTIKLYNNIIKKRKMNYEKIRIKFYRYYIFGLKIKKDFKFEIFSMFNNKLIKNIIPHNFEFLKSKYKIYEKPTKNIIYILGQQYCENYFIDKKHYFNFLNFCINKYSNAEIIYLMHRSEKEEKFKEFKSNHSNFKILKSNLMGEIFFINLDYKPKAIIGVATTLLFSLNKIYGNDKLFFYKFDDNKLLSNKEDVKKLYSDEDIKINKNLILEFYQMLENEDIKSLP